jgi:hypothetical protein
MTRDDFIAHLRRCIDMEFMHLHPSDAAKFLDVWDESNGHVPAEGETTSFDLLRTADTGCTTWNRHQAEFNALVRHRRLPWWRRLTHRGT